MIIKNYEKSDRTISLDKEGQEIGLPFHCAVFPLSAFIFGDFST